MNGSGDPWDGERYSPPAGFGQNPPGYGQGSGYGAGYEAPPAPPRNGFGIAALVLGLLALLSSWTLIGGIVLGILALLSSWTLIGGIVLGILALIFGLLGQGRAKRGEATNRRMSIAGVVLGIIGLLIPIGLIVFVLSLLHSPITQNYRQCIQQSGRDPARIQQCLSEFRSQFGD